MAFTNATRAIRNPRFRNPFVVERRAETVGDDGFVSTSTRKYPTNGVITAGGGGDLERGQDEQHMPKVLSVVTQFRLQGPAPGFQPDIIEFRGSRFVIVQLDDETQWGSGWVQAICHSIKHVDVAPGSDA
jgi:hypothetical protein